MTSYTSSDLDLVTEILSLGRELTLASIRPDGTPHASTVSYANIGLVVYFAVAIDSQKTYNIDHNSQVAFAVNTPYKKWREIRGLAVDAAARLVTGTDELALAESLLLRKYPEFSTVISNPLQLPWPGMLFIRCDPSFISLLDYTKGFGHTTRFRIGLDTNISPFHNFVADNR